MRFTGLGYYDLSSLYTSYIGKHKKALVESPAPHHHLVRALDLLIDKEETEVLKEWKSAQALLQKVDARLKALPNPADVQHAYILAFQPDAYTDWFSEEAINISGFMRVHLLLNPSPSFRIYSGEETISPSPWAAVAVNHRGAVSISNFNAPNTAHELVLELAIDAGG